MTTIRRLEKLWDAKEYGRLFRELLAARPEASFRVESELGRAIPTAAMTLIRLEELSQSHHTLYSRLVREILRAQEADGGWGDLMTSALCLRALLADSGTGLAIARGLEYLANLQKSEGIWPRVPIRRTEADAFVSAFVLHQLGERSEFRSAVRFNDALSWFERNENVLDAETRRLWDRARHRCRLVAPEPVLWS